MRPSRPDIFSPGATGSSFPGSGKARSGHAENGFSRTAQRASVAVSVHLRASSDFVVRELQGSVVRAALPQEGCAVL